MAELAVVRRYARALFDSAARTNQVDAVEADLKTVAQVLEAVPQMGRILRAPTISTTRKKALLHHAFDGRVGPMTLRFLDLTADRGRETILAEVHAEFQKLANEWRNVLPVQVWSAVPLTDEERTQLSEVLGRKTGKTVILEVSVDPGLVGGLVARMGDTVIDGSLFTRLSQVHARLLQSRVF
jgi:F-type H+-transporting ATPase subunit delta